MLGHGDSLALPAPCRRSPLSEESPMATTKKTTPKTTHVRGIANGPRAARQRLLDARPDTADFRDRMFEPTLVDVPTHVPLDRYLALDVPILDQRAARGRANDYTPVPNANHVTCALLAK